ncbi:MAG: F0F1 ATP synthase subunit delta [Candidatus Roizmanbacteria bacterium]|nr:F0F1 ATP synthase subunit delta [Candidatus Roizmanbacteria bacterium]
MNKASDTEKDSKSIDPSRLEAQMEKLAKNPAFLKKMENVVRREERVLTIRSPYVLSADEVKKIKQKLDIESRVSLRVNMVVDTSLLLGIIIKYKDYYFDYSLKGQIARLFESLEA